MGTVAAGSVSFDKAELMSLFSAGGKQQLFTITLTNHIKYFFFYINFSVFFLHMFIVFVEQDSELW